MFQSMMVQDVLLITFGDNELLMATYVLNCMPSKLVITNPYKLWIDDVLSLEHLWTYD